MANQKSRETEELLIVSALGVSLFSACDALRRESFSRRM